MFAFGLHSLQEFVWHLDAADGRISAVTIGAARHQQAHVVCEPPVMFDRSSVVFTVIDFYPVEAKFDKIIQ